MSGAQKRKASALPNQRENDKKRRKVEDGFGNEVTSESLAVEDFFGPKRSRMATGKAKEDGFESTDKQKGQGGGISGSSSSLRKPTSPLLDQDLAQKKHSSSASTNPSQTNELEKRQQRLDEASKELEKLHEVRKAIGSQPKERAFTDAVLAIAESIVDDLTLEICFEMHKKLKTGRICPKCSSRLLGNNGSLDIFGTNPNNYSAEAVTCLNIDCERSVAAGRYAPHLEKCLLSKTRGTGTRSRYIDYDENKEDMK